jgi:CheY-like chemotaxis protein
MILEEQVVGEVGPGGLWLAAPPRGDDFARGTRPDADFGGTGVRRRVLVVDDNIDMVRSMALMIRQMGHDVEYTINGYAGLDCARRFRPDVVFLDLVLPDIDGWEMARRLRSDRELKGLRIFAVTGQVQEGDRQRSLRAGCDDHLAKPLDPRVVESLLSAKQ